MYINHGGKYHNNNNNIAYGETVERRTGARFSGDIWLTVDVSGET